MNNSSTSTVPTTGAKIFAASFVVIVFAVLFFWLRSCGSDQPALPTYTKNSALVDSRQFVEKQLKSPASAQFDYSTDGTKQLNDTTFQVNSFVDSQNGFGAMLRTNYSCTITYSGKMVHCSELKLE